MDGVDKLFLPLLGKPLLSYALAAFEASAVVHSVVLVLNASNLDQGEELVRKHGFLKVTSVFEGGDTRQESVGLGLEQLPPLPWVIIHDGARPCLEPGVIERGMKEAVRWGSAIAAVPITDTLKIVQKGGTVRETPDRRSFWAAQTPQIFPRDVLMDAHRDPDVTTTDDASLVESRGHPVHVFFGSYSNIKVTTREDALMAETLLKRRAESST
jgi:2-C-methyl-D-erythritol 4-phosphate cytidylyltransferase